MDEIKKHLPLEMLVIITDTTRERKVEKILEKFNFPIIHQLRGTGTVKSEFLKIVGLSDNIRVITFTLMLRSSKSEVFHALEKELKIRQKGTGIAFTLPINGTQAFYMRKLSERGKKILEEKMEDLEHYSKTEAEHALILITMNQGYSDDIVATAREAGAYGGTVIRSRRRGTDKSSQFFGVSIQEEQEILAIIVSKDIKNKVMKTICDKWGAKTPAKAMVLSLPVDGLVGL
ncbi:MAG: hypothetical protein LUH14_02280 [Clostridiaceae bacterium]|nr:hypothetical protein [Clostridiaceae bacterium]